MRVVHCADVHLETTFPETRGGSGRRKGLADAFARIVDLALARDADVLTIGGDLYESARAGPQTARFLFAEFARFGKPIYIAPGNHDPHGPAALWTRDGLPGNVTIFTEAAWRPITLADGVTLFGFGHTPADPGRPFANAAFARAGVRLALVHGSDEDRCPPNKRATAPFTEAEARQAGATLVLTGHYHGGYVSYRDTRPVIAYPGSPEPIKFGELDVHGALEIDVTGDNATARALPTARTRLIDVTCDAAGAASEHALFARVEATLAPYGAHDYLRVRLSGSVLGGTRVDAALLEQRLGATLGSLEILDQTAAHDYAAIAREPTVRGHVVRDLLALGDDARPALRYALAAFDGSEIAP